MWDTLKAVLREFIALLKCVYLKGLPRWCCGKESACQCRRLGFDPWVRKIPWRRNWQPTPVFLPGKSHGQRSLQSYSPRGLKKSDTTEHTHTHTHIYIFIRKEKRSKINNLSFHVSILEKEEQIKSKVSKRRNFLNYIRNISEIENRKSVEKIYKNKSCWFFGKINKVDKRLAKSLRKNRRHKLLVSQMKERALL